MKIYLIRHGQTPWNQEKRLQGRSDIPLNEYGIHLARVTAEALRSVPFDRIYSSPLLRAYETAQILGDIKHLPVLTDDRLVEMSFGAGEGLTLAEVKSNPEHAIYRFLHDPAGFIPDETGESFESLYSRCQLFLDQVLLPAESSCKAIAVVSHGAMIRGMIHCVTGRPTADFWKTIHRNCSVTRLSLENQTFTMEEEAKTYYTANLEATW